MDYHTTTRLVLLVTEEDYHTTTRVVLLVPGEDYHTTTREWFYWFLGRTTTQPQELVYVGPW